MQRSRTRLGALGLTLILVGACGTTASPSTSGAPASAAASQDAAAIIADLEAKTKAEGALNSYGMPPDWTNFKEIWDTFLPKYGPSAGTPGSPSPLLYGTGVSTPRNTSFGTGKPAP